MFPIVAACWLAPGVRRIEVDAPRIARKQQPGQFVIVRVHDHGERIPLTIAASDMEAGTISLIVQTAGKTTDLLNRLEVGEFIRDVVGPLGQPSDVRNFGTVAVIGGGVGTAIAYPTAKALCKAGNRVIGIVGARTKELVILEAEMQEASDKLIITTDDGTYGRAGCVTDALHGLIDASERIDRVLSIGPIPMMKAIAEVTRPHRIPTLVSLNSIMVDGTGMCGGCRVLVGGEARFACVDGPEFDAHAVDFDGLAKRNAFYRESEKQSWDAYRDHPAADSHRVEQQCQLAAQYPDVSNMGTKTSDESTSQGEP